MLSLTKTLIPFALMSVSCLKHYDTEPHMKKLTHEEKMGNQPIIRLTAEGQLPSAETKSSANIGEEKFGAFCVTCHGANGDANTPAGQALNPKPRNFHEKAWQEKVTDERIAKVIKEGGASVGLSPSMAPWGGLLSDDEIKEVVKKVRSFNK